MALPRAGVSRGDLRRGDVTGLRVTPWGDCAHALSLGAGIRAADQRGGQGRDTLAAAEEAETVGGGGTQRH